MRVDVSLSGDWAKVVVSGLAEGTHRVAIHWTLSNHNMRLSNEWEGADVSSPNTDVEGWTQISDPDHVGGDTRVIASVTSTGSGSDDSGEGYADYTAQSI